MLLISIRESTKTTTTTVAYNDDVCHDDKNDEEINIMQHMGRICEWYVFLYDDNDDNDGDDKMRWGNFCWVVVWKKENLLEFRI